MIRSMTGYGNCRKVIDGREIYVEIRSVNHRYLELSCRVPKEMNFLEEKIKAEVKQQIFRGKADIYVSVGADENEQAVVSVNHALASGYIAALREIAEKYHLSDDISAMSLSRYNDIFKLTKPPADEEKLWSSVKNVLDEAIGKFIDMRIAEGEKLHKDITDRCTRILELVTEIEQQAPQIVTEYRKKLTTKINEMLCDATVDEQRIITEVAIFADRIAVDEETVRLKSHFEQFAKILESDGSVGRKTDFILQEMNRETNTIGSKIQDIQISHTVVEIKSELEKIREQIQNVE